MRTVSAQSVLEGILRREGGGNITVADIDAAQVAKFFDLAADRLRTAWEFHPWLETFETQKRFFRAEWLIGSTYGAGAELYFTDGADVSGYFTPVTTDLPAAGESPATDPDKWTKLTSMRRVVDFEQAGKTAFEGVAAAWDKDPDADSSARPVQYVLAGDGVVIPPTECVGDFVWLKIIKKCEDFAAILWVVGDAYTAGRVIYYATTGEVYEVVTTTTAGQTPLSEPAKFRQKEFPLILARAVKAGAIADWQRSDGKDADAMESQFYRLLDEQKWKLVGTQQQRGRIRFLR